MLIDRQDRVRGVMKGSGRSKIDCLARVQVVGDWLLMKGCAVGNLFCAQTVLTEVRRMVA